MIKILIEKIPTLEYNDGVSIFNFETIIVDVPDRFFLLILRPIGFGVHYK